MRRDEAWKLLALAPGLTPSGRRELLARSGGPRQAVRALLAGKCAAYTLPWDLGGWRRRAARVERVVRQAGGRAIVVDDHAYPPALRELADPPPVLYARGELPTAAGIAVVGSRECSGYGHDVAYRIAGDLAACGLPIVSGLARGVDAAAHRGAIAAGGVTVAVLPRGIESVYPPRHRALAGRIVERGALVTEFHPGTQVRRWCFPQRNRIIAGMSLVVIVVEAGERSGALSTARAAAEAGREVLAVPGPVDSPTSVSTNALLADGAHVCTGWRDVLRHLPPELARAAELRRHPAASGVSGELDGPQRLCFDALPPSGPCSLEALATRTSLQVPALLAALTELEVLGWVRAGANGYERVRFVKT